MAETRVVVKIGADVANFLSGIQKSGKSFTGFLDGIAHGMRRVGLISTAFWGGIIAGGALMTRSIVRQLSEFEGAVGSAAGMFGGLADDMIIKMREIASTSTFTATQVAQGMYYLGSSGLSAAESMKVLPVVLDLAQGTASDLAFTTESVVANLSRFNLTADDAGRVADTMAAGIAKSQLTMERLANFMPYAGAIAQGFNWTIEETIGIGGVLAETWGIKMAMAGAGLNAMMTRLVNVESEAAKVLKKHKIEAKSISPVYNKLGDIITTLAKANLSAKEEMELFGREGWKIWTSLKLAGAPAIEEMTKLVKESGWVSAIKAEQDKRLYAQLRHLAVAWEELKLKVGDFIRPVLVDVIDRGKELFKILGDWIVKNSGLIKQFLSPVWATFKSWLDGLPIKLSEILNKVGKWLTENQELLEQLISTKWRTFLDLLGDIRDYIEKVVDKIKDWARENPELAIKIAKVAAAVIVLSPLLLLLSVGVSAVSLAIKGLTGALGFLIAHPAVLAIAAIATSIYVLVDALQKGKAEFTGITLWFANMGDKLLDFGEKIDDVNRKIGQFVEPKFAAAGDWIGNQIDSYRRWVAILSGSWEGLPEDVRAGMSQQQFDLWNYLKTHETVAAGLQTLFFNPTIEGFKLLGDAVVENLNRAIVKIREFIDELGKAHLPDWLWNLMKTVTPGIHIPGLQKGGMIVQAHPGEVIAPLEKIPDIARSMNVTGGKQEFVMNVSGRVDYEEIYRQVLRKLNARRYGKVGIEGIL